MKFTGFIRSPTRCTSCMIGEETAEALNTSGLGTIHMCSRKSISCWRQRTESLFSRSIRDRETKSTPNPLPHRNTGSVLLNPRLEKRIIVQIIDLPREYDDFQTIPSWWNFVKGIIAVGSGNSTVFLAHLALILIVRANRDLLHPRAILLRKTRIVGDAMYTFFMIETTQKVLQRVFHVAIDLAFTDDQMILISILLQIHKWKSALFGSNF